MMKYKLSKENCQKILDFVKNTNFKIVIDGTSYKGVTFYDVNDCFCVYNNIDYDAKMFCVADTPVVDLEIHVMTDVTEALLHY